MSGAGGRMKRYDLENDYGGGSMEEHPEGDYVKYEDVLPLIELLRENQIALKVSFKLFEGLNLIKPSKLRGLNEKRLQRLNH
jgi:hypothetical protein